jgi:hypothetical protein
MSEYRKNTIVITVLSDGPIDDLPLERIIYECDEGSMVMGDMDLASMVIDRPRMDQLLTLAGSDPSFFFEDEEEEDE